MIDENTAKISMIPATWEQLAVSEVFNQISTNGKTIKQRDYKTEGKFPVIDQGEAYIGGYTDNPAAVIEVEDPLIAFGDHTRKFKFLSHDFVPGADGLKVLKPGPCLLTKFAYFGCLSLRLPDRGYARHYADLRKLRFPVAPIAEQERIVEKIETLFTQLDQGEATLRSVQTLLIRYRQSVLKAAVTGQLTADWRAENAQRLEHGRDLLQRILQTRRDNWQGRGKYKEPVAPDTSDLPELPEGWVWVTVDQATINHDGKRVPLKAADRDTRSGPYPYYGAQGIIDDIDDFLFDGTYLLVAEDGANLLSRAKPLAFQAHGKFWVNNHAHVMQPVEGVEISFLENAINSLNIAMSVTGTAQPKLTKAALERLVVPLPSLEEQRLIVELLSNAYTRTDVVMVACADELARSTALRQSILKDAFAGRLVPQDPNDEPASALLARIRAEREAATQSAHPTRSKPAGRKARSKQPQGSL